jgi:GNAT superfamily N-acetyltransferase
MEAQKWRIEWDVEPESIWKTRQRNLYPDQALLQNEALEAVLRNPTTICAAAIIHDDIIGCISVMNEPYMEFQLRIRWLGVDEAWRSKGIGINLVQRVQAYALNTKAGIWCNVRMKAIPLYKRLSFNTQGDAFDIEGVGPHLRMTWRDW